MKKYKLYGGKKMQNKKSLKILSVGNSFAVDTTEHAPKVALDLGFESVRMGTLYIGGCSIKRHSANARADAKAYEYYVSDGGEWSRTSGISIAEAIKSDDWDIISIQHGTGDGSRYTLENSYEELPYLVGYIKSLAPEKTKIAFNMAWVMEPDGDHHEIRSYNGDQLAMYKNLVSLTDRVVRPCVDIVSPVGIAVQNARASGDFGCLCRDGFHLSYTHGRYIAALTFLGALTGAELEDVSFAPEGVSAAERLAAIKCAKKAIGK